MKYSIEEINAKYFIRVSWYHLIISKNQNYLNYCNLYKVVKIILARPLHMNKCKDAIAK